MKRSELQQILKDRIEMRIRESYSIPDDTDYEMWAFAHFLADELISLIEAQGMQPPAYETYVKVDENLILSKAYRKIKVNKWEPEHETK